MAEQCQAGLLPPTEILPLAVTYDIGPMPRISSTLRQTHLPYHTAAGRVATDLLCCKADNNLAKEDLKYIDSGLYMYTLPYESLPPLPWLGYCEHPAPLTPYSLLASQGASRPPHDHHLKGVGDVCNDTCGLAGSLVDGPPTASSECVCVPDIGAMGRKLSSSASVKPECKALICY